jgi:predicted SAM-dependent methyltransferase
MVKLHLGSGAKTLKGFMSVDIEDHPNVEHVQDIRDLTDFSSGSVEEIYTSHSFEYFDRQDAELVLREWKRVLKKTGKIYITVPDFKSLLLVYESSGEDLDKILGPLFGRWKNVGTNATIYHKTVWDYNSLSRAMIKAGFIDVASFNPVKYLESIDPNYDDYSLAFNPHMDRNGIQISLAISGTNPE